MRGPRLVVALVVAGALTVLGAQSAGAAQSCTGEPGPADRFCADYTLAVSDSNAAQPFNLDVSIANNSEPPTTDTSKWFESITVELSDQTTAGLPVLTPSADLPNNLMLAGGTACTPPTYSTCDGGNGTLVANIASNFGPGTGGGAFGIEKVVNVNPPGAGNLARYRATIFACVTTQFTGATCFESSPITQDFIIPSGDGGTEPLVLTLDARNQQNFSSGPFTGTADYAFDTLSLHLEGSSNLVDGGPPLATPETIFTMPATCGTNTSVGTFTSGAPTRTVNVSQSFDVVGCPTAQVQGTASGLTAQLDGSGSAATVGGRTIAKYIWDFGDGATAETTQPTTSHTYATGGVKTVTLRVEDSAGARSAPVTTQVTATAPNPPPGTKTATTTTVTGKLRRGKVRVRGTVRPKSATGRVKLRLLRKKGRKFVLVKKTSKPLRNGAFSARFKGPSKTRRCKVIAIYPGDAGHKGSRRSKSFAC